ncbi:hypothetical protein P7C73_g864, partial [Tremellales sp. Uapishka_1]
MGLVKGTIAAGAAAGAIKLVTSGIDKYQANQAKQQQQPQQQSQYPQQSNSVPPHAPCNCPHCPQNMDQKASYFSPTQSLPQSQYGQNLPPAQYGQNPNPNQTRDAPPAYPYESRKKSGFGGPVEGYKTR